MWGVWESGCGTGVGECHSSTQSSLPRGQMKKGNLIIKMMMLKTDNDSAHIYWVPPMCQELRASYLLSCLILIAALRIGSLVPMVYR